MEDNELFNNEEILKDLKDIEMKFGLIDESLTVKGTFDQSLTVLSEEFDSLGLPPLNLQTTKQDNILEQVICRCRSLVQIYRNSLTNISDEILKNTNQNVQKNALYKQLNKYKEALEKHEEKYLAIQNRIYKLENELKRQSKSDQLHQDEMQRLKIYYSAKQKKLETSIQKLQIENERLKKICKENMPPTRNDAILRLLNKYQNDEETYKTTIATLLENNNQLMEEILTLRNNILLNNMKK